MAQSIIVVFVVLSFFGLVLASAEWGYNATDGPPHWKDNYPTCGEDRQSPIDIDTENAKFDGEMGAITMDGYDVEPSEMTISNTGHTVSISVGDADMTIQGAKLPATYKVESIDFHWGSAITTQGSEHTVDLKYFPVEMHVIHYNTLYNSTATAMNEDNGLAVLGFMFTVGEDDNAAFANIADVLGDVTYQGDAVFVTPFALGDLLPDNLTTFYRYDGSLTTPPCSETVTWTLFVEPIVISEAQMDKFYDLYFNTQGNDTADDVFMVNNFRPVQDLNGRKVTTTVYTAGATVTRPSDVILGMLVVAIAPWLLGQQA